MDGPNCTKHDGHPSKGIVYLVGGGPGDPGLLTIRGLECLRRADVAENDRLSNNELLTSTYWLLRAVPQSLDVSGSKALMSQPNGTTRIIIKNADLWSWWET